MVIKILVAAVIILIVIDMSCIIVGARSDKIMDEYNHQKHSTDDLKNT